MSSLVFDSSSAQLTPLRLAEVLERMRADLRGRVQAAYIFGSTSTGEYGTDSDIDVILVKAGVTELFPRRGFEFIDLFEIYPKIDLLVYTPAELEAQLADSEIGFWRSVRLSMKPIL